MGEYKNREYFHDDAGFTSRARELGTCIDEICGTTGAGNCGLGVGIFGFSQGGQLAFCVPDYAQHLTAVLSFSGSIHYGNSHRDADHDDGYTKNNQWATLSAHMSVVGASHRRLIMGATDGVMGSSGSTETVGGGDASNIVWGAQHVTGRDDADCPPGGPYASVKAGKLHCILADGSGYYENDDPIHGGITGLQSAFTNPTETEDWGLHTN